MTRLFDTVLIVDWSARSEPSPAAPTSDAIWIGGAGPGTDEPLYFRTRAQAEGYIAEFLAAALGEGRRVLVGFDFPFGFPRGFARALTGEGDALALWAHMAAAIEDGADNRNSRYAFAAATNRRFSGNGPFWGRPANVAVPAVPETKEDRSFGGFAEFRTTDKVARGARSVWQLAYAGSVGSQALLGIPAVHRLRTDPRLASHIAVWPFDSGLQPPDVPLVLAEVYPSLLGEAVRAAGDPMRDRAQVSVAARAYAELDAAGALTGLFSPNPPIEDKQAVTREEGWILGADAQASLRAAVEGARPEPPKLRNDCFALPPGVDWVPVDEAHARLRGALEPVAAVGSEPLNAALGRVLARPVRAARAHPAAANSAVDGYGFAHAGLGESPFSLPLVPGRSAAGSPFQGSVAPGHAVRVLTGAILPPGVDTVVLEEDCLVEAGAVHIERAPKGGANTRAAGEDVAEGDLLFEAGRVLTPGDLALAAATGLGSLPVRRPLRVAILSTGDELRAPGSEAAPHQTYDANRPMLAAILRRWGMEAVDLGLAADRAEAVVAALNRGAAQADAILTSGGASAGDEDHVSRTLREHGSLETWRVAVKPGRPLALGLWQGKPVFGLPGNPVAAFVCTLVFARPALMALAGAPWTEPRGMHLPAAFTKSKKAGRREYLRARLTSEGTVEAFRSEGSGRVSGLSWAEGLVELPDAAGGVKPGDRVRYLPFGAFGL
jgi:molybdopterin molybdotransferase